MASTVDPKVYDLAAHFLLDHPLLNTEAARVTLAAAIQETIDNELFFMADTMGAEK